MTKPEKLTNWKAVLREIYYYRETCKRRAMMPVNIEDNYVKIIITAARFIGFAS